MVTCKPGNKIPPQRNIASQIIQNGMAYKLKFSNSLHIIGQMHEEISQCLPKHAKSYGIQPKILEIPYKSYAKYMNKALHSLPPKSSKTVQYKN